MIGGIMHDAEASAIARKLRNFVVIENQDPRQKSYDDYENVY